MEYRRSLDGVRALCAAAVFASHGFPGHGAGFLGVDVFFVLSGYLITRLLLDDVDHHGRVRIGRFYARRARRVLPALFVTIALAFALWPAGERQQLARILPPVLFYYVNWCLTFGHPVPFLPHFWTLSVEEQFYLLWPLAVSVVAARGRFALAAISGALILACAAARAALSFARPPLSYIFGFASTLGRADQLLIGACAAAMQTSADPRWRDRLACVAGALAWPSALGLAAVMIFMKAEISPWFARGGYTAIALASAVVVVHCSTGARSRLNRLLGARPLAWVGRRSYGFYLFHLPIIEALDPLRRRAGGAGWLVAALSACATLLLAWASYDLVESRFLMPGRLYPASVTISPRT